MQYQQLLESYHIVYTPRKEDQLAGYMELILERNQHVNLTAITDADEFLQKHYADSLTCCVLPDFLEAKTVIDVGTGGGFPGVPLAIAYPDKEFVLIDSLQKRIKIINEFCQVLGIHNVRAIHGRAEELARGQLREHFDCCVSRAVANLSTLSEYCLPFIKVGGSFLAYKGPQPEEEVASAQRAIALLGGGTPSILSSEQLLQMRQEDPEEAGGEDGSLNAPIMKNLDHSLVVIRKSKPTPKKYPRKAGLPGKEPL